MSSKEANFKNAWTHSKKHAGKSNKSKLETRIKIGRYNRLSVQTISDFGVYLGAGDDPILLPNKYVPAGMSIGDILDVFVYTDSEDRLVAIRKRFSMSKKEFKGAVSSLYKKRLIELKDNGIALIK